MNAKKVEHRNVLNPKEWIVEGTNIFIIPQLVVQSNNPLQNKYNIRHGWGFVKGNRFCVCQDTIEDGSDELPNGGFQSFAQITNWASEMANICEKIYDYVAMGMYDAATEYWFMANKKNKFYAGASPEAILKRGRQRVESTSEESWGFQAIAWRQTYLEWQDAIKRGVIAEPFGFSMH